MPAGKPVVAAINSEASTLILPARCGQCVTSGDSIALGEAMSRILGDWDRIHACGTSARRYYEDNFTLKRFLDSLVRHLHDLTALGSPQDAQDASSDEMPATTTGDADVS